jgi:predicted P-loop ATPase
MSGLPAAPPMVLIEGGAPYRLDRAAPLPMSGFPNQPLWGQRTLPTTIANVQHVLREYGVRVWYDLIAKRIRYDVPGVQLSAESADAAMSEIVSLCVLNGLQLGPLRDFIVAVADRNRINPVKDWIKSRAWDGVDRFEEMVGTITLADGYPPELLRILLYRWLLSAVAAALMDEGFRSRGVLTLQGPQGIGKTAFQIRLVPPELQARFIKVDHLLDPQSKDSQLGAISHWIVELGELDSSFKKDVARLKGFLTAPFDKLRRPYGRDEIEYPRRTVFTATVNDRNFLVDSTGNSRFWTIEVKALNYLHDIDMQQLFAQLAVAFEAGERWWLDEAEERMLDDQNRTYLAASVVRDRLSAYLVGIEGQSTTERHMTATELLETIGFKQPGNAQVREAVPIFTERLGPRRKVRGKEGWKVAHSDQFTSV